jgi:hypothetical protein
MRLAHFLGFATKETADLGDAVFSMNSLLFGAAGASRATTENFGPESQSVC